VAKPLPGRPALHPHIGYGGKLTDLDCTCFGCVNCMIQQVAGEGGGRTQGPHGLRRRSAAA
jgi:hypothetical protein